MNSPAKPTELIHLFADQLDAPERLAKLRLFLEAEGLFDFPILENGLCPAAGFAQGDADVSGYSNVWIRDNVFVALAHCTLGSISTARKALSSMLKFYALQEWRLTQILAGELDPSNPMNRPHIRFDGATLAELDETWPHAQNDALGYLLWLAARMCLDYGAILDAREYRTLQLLLAYLGKIEFWHDEDSGHWEEVRKISASSVGVVAAALLAIQECVNRGNPLGRAVLDWEADVSARVRIDELLNNGQEAMRAILPFECRQSDPKKRREHDAALLFLVFPLHTIDAGADMARQIVDGVHSQLQGEWGIRRYRGDSYWAPDYKEIWTAEQRTQDFSQRLDLRDQFLRDEGGEAQWCLFDPILSCIHGVRYQTTGEIEELDLQIEFLQRSLRQILPFDRPGRSIACPELYYLSRGSYVPNDHIPLFWAEANLLSALEQMTKSLKLQR